MLASTLRLATVVLLCVLVVREILNPELDAVRNTYPDDPDGGLFDGTRDAPWMARWRRPDLASPQPKEPVTVTAPPASASNSEDGRTVDGG